MKRFALFSCFLFLCLLVSKANPISRSQALSQAKEFLSSKGIGMKTDDAAYRAPRKANAQSDENSAYYYVFNAGNDQGFVIVSGDDRTEQILGYSDTGSFDEDNVPEPLQEWLKGYEREIEALGDVEVFAASPKKVMEKTKKAIPPMTTSKWGHGWPFKSKTPTIDEVHCTVGCVPCTVAQFLYFNRDKGVSATTGAIANGSSTISAGTKIDWNNMLDDYSYKGYTTTQSNAVANLMLYCGRALGATYGKSATSVTFNSVIPALINSFGYNSECAMVFKNFYSCEEWESIMYNELENGRIVIYCGTNSSNVGHALILDGYDPNGLFHINWGWAGSNNGFFRLSVLNRYNPYTIISGAYSSSHLAYMYLSPQKSVSLNPQTKVLSALFTGSSGTNITCAYYNQSGLSASYYLGIGFLDDNDNVHFLKQYSTTATSLSNQASATRTFNLTASDFANNNLSVGQYKIVPIYKLSNETEWKKCQHDIGNHVVASYSSSGVSASLYSNLSNLEISNVEFVGNGLKGSEQVINATIKNNSKQYSYIGTVYLFASTTTTKGSSLGNRAYSLGVNDSVVVSIPFTPSAAGTYNIWLASNSTGSSVINKGTTKLTIKSATASALDISGIGYSVAKNYAGTVNDKKSIWGTTFAINFTGIKNNSSYPIVTKFNAWLREYDSVSSTSWNSTRYTNYKDNAQFQPIEVVVPAKSTITVPVVFENVKLNTRYDIRLEYASDGTMIKIIQPFVFLPAVTTYQADGTSVSVAPTSTVKVGTNVVAVDITSATAVTTITPNSNPNVLYYMAASQTTPSGLTGKNVVKGTTADKITLKDNYNFVIPKSFTAKTIQFSTTPTKGAKKGSNVGWNTISLPFDVTKVMNTTDNVEIDWFHSDEDAGKNFWIRGFEYLDTEGDNVFFNNSAEMLAYEPYIINVPGEYYGNKWNLIGKEITFYGENADLHEGVNQGVSSSVCNFLGTPTVKKVTDSYVLNDEGNYFLYKEGEQTVQAFHGYFHFKDKGYLNTSTTKAKLSIKFVGDEDNTTDGVMIPFASENEMLDVYNLNGVKVATTTVNGGSVNLDELPKGVYVIKGQKYIRY
ncbi:MAG: thiol protease/hemagglutinin PrtT [Prevotella sp.]|nr:thiol protease/hemagglutinin PrtT [Prevotella sp.]